MKYFILIMISTCLHGIIHGQGKEMTSSIDRVVVFSNGAQLYRKAKVQLNKGSNEVIISGLPKSLIQNTISVKSQNSKVRSILFRINYIQPAAINDDQKSELLAKRKSLENKMEELRVKESIGKEEEAFLISNRSIASTERGVGIQQLKSINEYYTSRLSQIYEDRSRMQQETDDLKDEIARIDHQLNYKEEKINPLAGELLLEIDAARDGLEDLEICYYTEHARWWPSYDFRIEKINQPMEVTYIANITQVTGEDWENVSVTVSSTNPKESSRAPKMEVWELSSFERAPYDQRIDDSYVEAVKQVRSINDKTVSGKVISTEDGSGLPGVNVIVAGTSIGTITDIDGRYSLEVPDDNPVLQFSFIGLKTREIAVGQRRILDVGMEEDVQILEEVVVSGYRSSLASRLKGKVAGIKIRGAASPKFSARSTGTISSNIIVNNKQVDVEFSVKGLQTILSKPDKKSLDLITYQPESTYQYVCMPRYNTNVFLFAYLRDWEDMKLLSGEANIFFEGVYKGKTLVDISAIADTLKLSVGVDHSIKVEYENIGKKNVKLNTSKKRRLVDIEYKIKNTKQEQVNLLLRDQVPISYLKQIEVTVKEKGAGQVDPKKGFVSWNLTLSGGETQKERLAYLVKFPDKVRVPIN